MAQKLTGLVNSSILYCYFALVIITPLLFSTQNSELFEVPKMLFVYFFAATILILTKIKFVLEKKKSIPVDLITISFVVFLSVQIASTATSIDKFTSIFGYPSRLNGGLLSQFAYLIIFVGAIINLTGKSAKKLIAAAILSAFAVALWGIPSHFGYDPNCLILTGNLNSTCWQVEFDPTKRIFSTLGQPNWLASYLVLILPISLSHIFTTKVVGGRITFAIASLVIFIAFIFTNSRAGLAGLVVAICIFLLLLGAKKILKNLKFAVAFLALLAISLAIFGQQLILRIGEIKRSDTSAPTESGKIRLIVWQGALDIAKQNPILGTGPETFAYSYYKVRPLAHNQTTEWNFFYNKAHNEFLNYLANTGVPGLLSYLIFLAAAIFTIVRISRTSQEQNNQILMWAIAAAIAGYEVTIFFGFSTVATSLLMFILIASAMKIGNQTKFKEINLPFLKSKIPQITALGAVGAFGLYIIIFVARLFLADVLENQAKSSNWENPQTLLTFTNAISTSPVANPFYLSDAAFAFASYSTSSQKEENIWSKEQSAKLAKEAQEISGQNIIIARRIASAYILLAHIDESFYNEAQKIGQIIVALAPTDPQSYLTLAKIQITTEENEKTKNSLQKALELKPNYKEAQELLEQLTIDN